MTIYLVCIVCIPFIPSVYVFQVLCMHLLYVDRTIYIIFEIMLLHDGFMPVRYVLQLAMSGYGSNM